MTGSELLPLPVAVPLGGAAAAPLLARVSRRLPLLVGGLAMLASAVLLGTFAPRVFGGRPLTCYMGHWGPVRGYALGIAFTADPLGLVFALATALVGGLLLVYTLSELGGLGSRELGGYAAMFQLLLAALIGTALTADLFNLFVWFEVAALASYGLTGFFLERPIALEAAFKILVMTTVASFGVFIGTGMLYSEHGALNFGQLHTALAGGVHAPDVVALVLLVTGYATKAGLIPFHGWLADAHTAAPGPVSALFSGLMVNLGVLAVARLAFQVYGPSHLPVLGLLMTFGLVSALLGAVLALAQDDLKRLLAYDTISQMGVLAVGLATASPAGTAGAAYHLLNHALFKSLLFLGAGAIVHRTGVTLLSEMGGLWRRMPVIAVAFAVGVASIAGIPPFNGYASLSLIHHGLIESHQMLPTILLALAQAITIGALGRALWLAFLRPAPAEGGPEPGERLRPGMLLGFGGLAVCCVGLGVLSAPVLDHVMAPAAASLLHGDAYAAAVLGSGGRLPAMSVPLDYGDPAELAITAGCLAAGALLAWRYVRMAEPAPVRSLRALHNGSVNDYTAYLVAGALAVAAVLVVF